MSSLNKVYLLGNLAGDPELRYTSGGTPVSNFSVATNERGSVDKASGERKQITNFHRIIAWGKLAETCSQYLSKGRQVIVEGRLQYRTFKDKEGIDRKVTEIVANTVQFLGGPRKEATEPAEVASQDMPSDEAPALDEAAAE